MQVREESDTIHMAIELGPNRYPGNLTHWNGNTWYLSFPNPDDQVGYITFEADNSGFVDSFTSEEFGQFLKA